MDLNSKIDIAIKLVKQFMDSKELIYVVDEGGIILPNSSIVEWFTDLVNADEFENNLALCLISKYRPNKFSLKKEKKSLTYRIPEL